MPRNAVLSCMAVLAMAATARAQEQAPRLVTMTGHAMVQATPDRAWVTLGVEARDPFIQGRRNLRGYVVSNQIEVRVDDIAKVSAVLDGAVASGANIIHGVRWDMKNRQALERQALQLAFEDARARAAVIADASGSVLGRVHGVQESRAGAVVRPIASMQMAQAAVAESVTVINPGEIDIRATVTVSFQLR